MVSTKTVLSITVDYGKLMVTVKKVNGQKRFRSEAMSNSIKFTKNDYCLLIVAKSSTLVSKYLYVLVSKYLYVLVSKYMYVLVSKYLYVLVSKYMYVLV